MLKYPLHIEPDGDGYLVTCPDLPEVTSDGDTLAEALANGADAIEEAIAGRLSAFEDIPSPSDGEVLSDQISLSMELKVLLFWRLAEVGETRAGLARRLGWHRNSVDRLFYPTHKSQLDQLDAAFRALDTNVSIFLTAA